MRLDNKRMHSIWIAKKRKKLKSEDSCRKCCIQYTECNMQYTAYIIQCPLSFQKFSLKEGVHSRTADTRPIHYGYTTDTLRLRILDMGFRWTKFGSKFWDAKKYLNFRLEYFVSTLRSFHNCWQHHLQKQLKSSQHLLNRLLAILTSKENVIGYVIVPGSLHLARWPPLQLLGDIPENVKAGLWRIISSQIPYRFSNRVFSYNIRFQHH